MKMMKIVTLSMALVSGVYATGTGFYVGAGLGVESVNSFLYDDSGLIGGVFKAGYIPQENIALEFRGESSFTDGDKLTHGYSIGMYVKPQYEFMEDWTFYGLLGYGQNKISFPDEETFNGNPLNETTVAGLSYGAGVEFRVANSFSVFVEGLQLVDETTTENGDDFAINVSGIYAGISYYFDAKPQVIILPTTIKYTKTPQKIQILFDTGKWDVKQAYHKELINYANFLHNNPDANMDIMGHTDSRSSDRYNLTLSKNRAEAIRQFIVGRGISASRINALGLGEGYPIANNKTAEGRAKNRRIEAKIYR